MVRRPPLPRKDFRADQLEIRFERAFPADVTAMEAIVHEIMGIVTQAKCAIEAQWEVELALREALANAVLHGAKGDSAKQVAVSVACADRVGVLIVVRDPGEGFDPNCVPSPLIGENVYSNHGRGIFLINQIMDEVRFEKGGTEIHMLKRPSGPAAQSEA
ncbi:MAG: ATP-binding protein [Acidobacteriota bacterium]